MRKHPCLSACVSLLQANVPHGVIAKSLRMRPSAVDAIARDENPYSDKPRGRPTKITQEIRDFMDINWGMNSMISDAQMASMVTERFGVTLSPSSARRERNRLKYFYRPPRVKQELTKEQKQLRFEFCKWVLSNEEKIPNIVFSDESRFERGPDNSWRRIKRGVINESIFVEKKKYPQSVMIWGAIGIGFKSSLMKCSSGMDAAEYCRVLEDSGLLEQLNARHGKGRWSFMHDGAPCHEAGRTSEFLAAQRVVVVAGWPPTSPDLNPIEMIWSIMKRRIQGRWEAGDAFQQLAVVWEQLAYETIDGLVRSFRDRCKLVYDLGGGSATPYLSSHKQPPPGRQQPPGPEWTDDQDSALLALHDSLGPRWRQIAGRLSSNPIAVKHRFRWIKQIEMNERHQQHELLPPIDSWLPEWSFPPDDLDKFLQFFPPGTTV